MANYEVDPELLLSRVPAGTELDLFDDKCFVSLVGFMFLDTRVLGVPVPFHINFEEVNLRFYVKRIINDEVRRGVVFIKEIVPRLAIATVARVLYGEPYEAWQMSNERTSKQVAYMWSSGEVSNRIRAERGEDLGVPDDGSHGSFIIEHYWGYTKRGVDRTDEYRVTHPKWNLHSTKDDVIEVGFASLYGQEFAFLAAQEPYSVFLAAGSEIAVYKGERIK